jgi:hypothetical protein
MFVLASSICSQPRIIHGMKPQILSYLFIFYFSLVNKEKYNKKIQTIIKISQEIFVFAFFLLF